LEEGVGIWHHVETVDVWNLKLEGWFGGRGRQGVGRPQQTTTAASESRLESRETSWNVMGGFVDMKITVGDTRMSVVRREGENLGAFRFHGQRPIAQEKDQST